MALFENCGQPVLHVANTSSYTPLPLHPAFFRPSKGRKLSCLRWMKQRQVVVRQSKHQR